MEELQKDNSTEEVAVNVAKEVVEKANVCVKCGAELAEGQEFCSKCGKKVELPKDETVCSKCGADLVPGQEFCSKCGKKVGPSVAEETFEKLKPLAGETLEKMKPPAGELKSGNKKIIGIVAGVAVVIIIVLALALSGGTKDMIDVFGNTESEWMKIGDDGSWMKLDTNPNNIDDFYDPAAVLMIKAANTKLGFTEAVYSKMMETRSVDGRLSEENDDYIISWTYHPDNGLEVLYELNK